MDQNAGQRNILVGCNKDEVSQSNSEKDQKESH